MFSIILKELLESQDILRDDNLGITMEVYNFGQVNLHFELCFVIGDTAGHDILCCHSMVYSKRIERPVRTCNVSWENLDNPYTSCQFVESQKIYDIVNNCIDKFP